ncbi:MAG: nucleotidyltransferase domain-containing protein [Myxococcales bacterium]|nr:nucleotidyltransferase domain-containing protein [Myxococcales bacterium]
MSHTDLPPNALPDLELGRRFIAQSPVPGAVLQCGVTGSHDYGFSSPDSDLDLKGIFLAPTRRLLGLSRPPESFDRLVDFEGSECDLTLTEAGKALHLLVSGNGNVIERLLSKFQLYPGEELDALQALARGAVSKKFSRHYQGFFRGMCKEHERSERPRAKSLLYAYRVALTGIHLLRTGELVADLRTLAPMLGYPDALALVRIKVEGAEKGAVTPEIDAQHRAAWPALEADLQRALDTSPLPESAANEAACEDWLVELRCARL